MCDFNLPVSFNGQVQQMKPAILQFLSLEELASYARQLTDKGFQINTQNLTLKTRLSEDDIRLARKQFRAKIIGRLYG